MERIVTYDDLPRTDGQSVYFRMETDPKLYFSLLAKGFKVINNIDNATDDTIYITGRRQDYKCSTAEEYKEYVRGGLLKVLNGRKIYKPKTQQFNIKELFEHKYTLPFVLKNENQNGGREKFLIQTEEDYENLIDACSFLLDKSLFRFISVDEENAKRIDYYKYLTENFTVQEYIKTPSKYNTTVRLLSSSSNNLLYASLKYNKQEELKDHTTLLGYLLSEVYPLSTKSIVSNTLSGGENILIGEKDYSKTEKELLDAHNIKSEKFEELVQASLDAHEAFKNELGIICGFDYIYDQEKDNWNLLEYHTRPMVGDYSKRNGLIYNTREERIEAEGRVRATALSLKLKK